MEIASVPVSSEFKGVCWQVWETRTKKRVQAGPEKALMPDCRVYM